MKLLATLIGLLLVGCASLPPDLSTVNDSRAPMQIACDSGYKKLQKYYRQHGIQMCWHPSGNWTVDGRMYCEAPTCGEVFVEMDIRNIEVEWDEWLNIKNKK